MIDAAERLLRRIRTLRGDARIIARKDFGNVTVIQEQGRARVRWAESLVAAPQTRSSRRSASSFVRSRDRVALRIE